MEQLVAEYESSGLSRIDFCRERGLGLSTLDRYRTQQKGRSTMSEIVFFREEESAKALLEQLFPLLIPEGSQVRRQTGSGEATAQETAELSESACPVHVMRTQDQGDCRRIKRSLAALCPVSHRPRTIVRIACQCHELESFYLGDLQAVESGLGVRGLAGKQNNAKFRDPDHLSSPSRELEKLPAIAARKLPVRALLVRISTC